MQQPTLSDQEIDAIRLFRKYPVKFKKAYGHLRHEEHMEMDLEEYQGDFSQVNEVVYCGSKKVCTRKI